MSTTDVVKIIEPYVDLGNLLLIDRDPMEGLPNIDEAQLADLSRKNAQYLFNKIWSLPRKIVQDATCAQLPECEYALPREKPIPKPKEPTKWERFANAKGIVKKDKSKKVWDDSAKDWKPRYGYRRANDEKQNNWLIEIPDQADPYKDYFAEKADAKRERLNKEELQRLKNVARSTAQANQSAGPPLLSQSAAFQKHAVRENQAKHQQQRKRGGNDGDGRPLGLGPTEGKSKEQIIHQLNRAKNATASVGKFQPTLKGEKTPRNMGIKRKFEPNEGNVDEEKKRQMGILEKMQNKKPKLAESRINAVNEHMKRAEKSRNSVDDGDEQSRGGVGGKKGAGGKFVGKSGRPKSQIDRQQRFQQRKKMTKKSGFKSARSKAGRAAGGKGGGGGGGRKGGRK